MFKEGCCVPHCSGSKRKVWTCSVDQPAPPPARSGVAGGLANSEVRMWQSWLQLKNIQIIVFTSLQRALKAPKGLNHICKFCRVFYILLLCGAVRKQNRLHRKCRWASSFHSSAPSHACSESSCPLWEDHRFCSQTRFHFHLQPLSLCLASL